MKKPKSYYCHKSQESSFQIADNLEVVQKIGEGAFGEVFKVFDHNSSQIKVIKRHKRESSKAVINKQNQVMKELSGSQGFAKIKQFYSQTAKTRRSMANNGVMGGSVNCDNNANKQNEKLNNEECCEDQMIMMECLGQNLGKIVQKKTLTIFTMKRIAEQLVYRLKELHDKSYVHRDLKPENILLGNQLNPHKIYLVDFGLVSTYRKEPKKIRKIYDGLIGTAKYCPLASHYGNEQFPKDDLQSLGYVLVYLIKGQLPWKYKEQISDQQKFQRMKVAKQTISVNDLTGNVHCLKKYFTYIKSLTPTGQIDYNFLLSIFKTDSKEQFCYEFCKQNCFFKLKRLESNKISTEDKQQKYEKNQLESFKKNNIGSYSFQSKFIKQ